jgi:hypothetical protein
MYTPCVGRFEEAISRLDRGRDIVHRMEVLGKRVYSKIEDPARAQELENALALTRALIETNYRYVKTCFAYFSYCDAPNEANRRRLSDAVGELTAACHHFAHAPGFVYKLYGIEQLLVNARESLQDVHEAQRRLVEAPDAAEVEALVAQYQKAMDSAWAKHSDRVSLLHWRGRVDGKEILHLQASSVDVEHVEGDHAQVEQQTVYATLPDREVTVLVQDNTSRPWGPFVLEQPGVTNNYRARILLFDAPPSSGTFDFEVAYVDGHPADLNLAPPWSGQFQGTPQQDRRP